MRRAFDMAKRILCWLGFHKKAPYYVGWKLSIWHECERCKVKWKVNI